MVAYRGSYNLANGIEDAEFWMVRAPFGPAGIEVDHGFLAAYLSVRNQTIAAVGSALSKCDGIAAPKSSGRNCSVLFTGHSLGAAMATLGAAELTTVSPPIEGVTIGAAPSVRLFTFGSPRVGNAAFASWADGQLAAAAPSEGGSRRMRRQKDIVPAIPPRSLRYVHLATEIYDKHLGENGSYTCAAPPR